MNNTLYNGFKLLDFLAVSAELVSVKELAEHFQLPNSHICRLLKTLVETGYVEQDPATRKYRISLKILNLAHSRLQSERLPELARPYIRKLAEKLDATVFVTRTCKGRSLIIATEYPDLALQNSTTVTGALHSPTSSACGQICAAYAEPEVQTALLDETDWSAPGDFQNRREAFEKELLLIRNRGYALRDPACHHGAIGVPLFDGECRCYGALGVMLTAAPQSSDELFQSVIESTLNCGKLISFAIGAPFEGYPYFTNSAARRKKK